MEISTSSYFSIVRPFVVSIVRRCFQREEAVGIAENAVDKLEIRSPICDLSEKIVSDLIDPTVDSVATSLLRGPVTIVIDT